MDDYVSKITDSLVIIGTENKDKFTTDYLENQELRSQTKLIGTHSDVFHCDEVMATTMMLYTKQWENSIIVRTRDQPILDRLDAQVDVGAIYDPANGRFDHHQGDFINHWWEDTTTENEGADPKKWPREVLKKPAEGVKAGEKTKAITRFSSAGLIYKHFGKEVIKNVALSMFKRDLNEKTIEMIFQKLYKQLILEIDAIDNGVNQADDMVYSISTNISGRVGTLNPPWNAPQGLISPHA